MRAFASLAACVGVLLLIYLFIKKYAAKRNNTSIANGETLSVISRMPISPRGMLCIVAIGKRRLLIGSTEHNISLVADLTENSTVPNTPNEPVSDVNSSVTATKTTSTVKMPQPDFEGDDSASFSTFLKTVLSRESIRK